ncbi:MAG: hypothetical protein QW484_02915 [Candidatus Pacearchaeota archaeon]
MVKRGTFVFILAVFLITFLIITSAKGDVKWMGYCGPCKDGELEAASACYYGPYTVHCGNEFGDGWGRDNSFGGVGKGYGRVICGSWWSGWDDTEFPGYGFITYFSVAPTWNNVARHFSSVCNGCGATYLQCQVGWKCISCPTDKRNCDKNDETGYNGCETDILNDPNNCGNCGVKCQSGQICQNGQCGAVNECEQYSPGGWVKPTVDHSPCTGSWDNYVGCVKDSNNNGLYNWKCCPVWDLSIGAVQKLVAKHISELSCPIVN